MLGIVGLCNHGDICSSSQFCDCSEHNESTEENVCVFILFFIGYKKVYSCEKLCTMNWLSRISIYRSDEYRV